MAVQANNNKTRTLRSILEEAYKVDGKVDTNAVLAAEHFVSVYQTWQDVSDAITDREYKLTLDFIVTGVFSGESLRNAEFSAVVSSFIAQASIKAPSAHDKLTLFIIALLSGEGMTNPFIMEHKERLGAAVLLDCLNESSRRVMQGKAKEAADINKWAVLSIIAFIVSGTNQALSMNINLKMSFGYG